MGSNKINPIRNRAGNVIKDIVKISEIYKVMDEWKKLELTKRQLLFIYYYINTGFNGSKSIELAGYKAKNIYLASQQANQLLKNIKVKKAIEIWKENFLEEIKNKLEPKIVNVLMIQAFYDPSMFVKPDGTPNFTDWKEIPKDYRVCIAGIEKKYYGKDAERQTIKVDLVNRDKALEKLEKYINMIKDVKEIKVTTDKEVENKLNDILNISFEDAESEEVEIIPEGNNRIESNPNIKLNI